MRRRTTGFLAGAAVLAAAGLAQVGIADADTTAACTGNPLPSTSVTATLIRDGFNFTEGPTWVADPGFLLFSDMQNASGAQGIQAATIWKFTPPAAFEEFIPNSGSNGLAITPAGDKIIAATQDQQAVSAFTLADHTRSTLAANFQGRHFNSPNDLTIAADGTVYFTDPNFQRGKRADEQGGVTGVYRVRNGVVDLIDGTVSNPNGVALSPDGKTLYVGGSNKLFAYPVQDDGSIGTRRTFASLAGPDGVTIDCAGNLYWAAYSEGRVHVIAPDGTELGTISAGRNVTNVAFGGPNRQTLFITSGTTGNFGIYSVQLNLPGNPF